MSESNNSVQRQFAPATTIPANTMPSSSPDLAAMLKAASLRGDEHVLDAGCGTGYTALAFAPYVAELVAIDQAEVMLVQGRRQASQRGITNITFRRGSAERLPFADASFDLIISHHSGHHYSHPLATMQAFARLLKPGGRLLLLDVVAPEQPALDTFLNAIELLRDPSHVRDHTAEQWLGFFAAAGFSGEVLGSWMLRLEFESWVARLNTPFLAITQIRALIEGAPREVRAGFEIEEGYSFSVPTVLIAATRALNKGEG